MPHFVAIGEFKLVLVWKRLIWVKIDDFFCCVPSKLDGWPSKTIWHLFYATLSFVQKFISMGEFKLELQSGNAKSRSKSKFFEPCDLEIWRMTLQNNWAPLLSMFKLYASFYHHIWIQTGVTVRKHLIWVKFDDFHSSVTLKFDGWPSKTIGHLFYATSSFVYHFVAFGEFKLELQSGNAQSGSN